MMFCASGVVSLYRSAVSMRLFRLSKALRFTPNSNVARLGKVTPSAPSLLDNVLMSFSSVSLSLSRSSRYSVLAGSCFNLFQSCSPSLNKVSNARASSRSLSNSACCTGERPLFFSAIARSLSTSASTLSRVSRASFAPSSISAANRSSVGTLRN